MRKRGQIWETLIPWIIAIGVLALGLILIVVLKGKGEGALEFLKRVFRFGR